MAKGNKNTSKGVIIGICSAVIVIALIVVAVVLGTRNGGFTGLNDSFFTSDDSKLVLDMEADNFFADDEEEYAPEKFYLVYSYSGDKITGLKAYYKYPDANKAEAAFEYLSKNIEDEYKSISQDGIYIILEANESEYEGVTADDVKQQIEFIKMIREQGQEDSESDEIQVESIESPEEDSVEDTEIVEE